MSADIEELIRTLRGLVDAVGRQAEADAAAFREAYTLGFEAGRRVGRTQVGHELAELDRRGRQLADLPAYAELEARRWDS